MDGQAGQQVPDGRGGLPLCTVGTTFAKVLSSEASDEKKKRKREKRKREERKGMTCGVHVSETGHQNRLMANCGCFEELDDHIYSVLEFDG
jgi:hypothetical protein